MSEPPSSPRRKPSEPGRDSSGSHRDGGGRSGDGSSEHAPRRGRRRNRKRGGQGGRDHRYTPEATSPSDDTGSRADKAERPQSDEPHPRHSRRSREGKYLWGEDGALRQPLMGVPAALGVIVAMIAAGLAMDVYMRPLLPFVAIGVLCIVNWEMRWARGFWYVTLVTYALWLAAATVYVWFPFFLALVFAYVASPVVDGLTRMFRQRAVAVSVFFTVMLSLLAVFNWFAYAELSTTVQEISKRLNDPVALQENVHNLVSPIAAQMEVSPERVDRFSEEFAETVSIAMNRATNVSEESLTSLIGRAGETLGYVGALALNFLLFLVAAFYLLLGWPKLTGKLNSYLSPQRSERLSVLSQQIARILRQYLQGHSLVCLLVGLIFYLLLMAFGHPHALLLGLLMAVLGLIPFLGPILGGVIAVCITLTVPNDLGWHLATVVISYTIAQGLNDFVLYPNIAGRAVHVNPVVALLVLFLIGHGFGVLGMFFAVPLVAITRAVITWMNEEHIPGFEWLKLFRPYEVRHEHTLRRRREDVVRAEPAT